MQKRDAIQLLATMTTPIHTLPLLLAAIASASVSAAPVHYVNSRLVVLSFQPAAGAEIDQVHVWISKDDGKAWLAADATRIATHALQLEVPQDGKYFFYLVLENAAGRSAEPPSAGSLPHAIVIVDTVAPALQLHGVQQTPPASDAQPLQLRLSLIEENLGDGAPRLFYRSNPDAAWQGGGPVVVSDGIIAWLPPADISVTVDVRVIVTDLAGNQAADELRDIRSEPPRTEPSPIKPNADLGLDEASPATAGDLLVPPLPPVTLAPVPAVALDEPASPAPASQPSPDANGESRRLREQAAAYLAQGHLSLAGARLQQALEAAPNDPDLLVDLGSVLYRGRRYDEADRRFQDALDSSPEHLGAIEGLALVAATQNRYPQARSHLEHLLRIVPDSAKHWLHYGDVQHMLGNANAAHDAWEKVLEFEPADKTVREKAQKRLKLFGQTRPELE